MPLSAWLLGDAALLVLGFLGVFLSRARAGSALVYSAAFVITALLCGASMQRLLTGGEPATLTLPFGLPWLGAHFRIDTISTFFLAVVNFGAAAASFFAIGYGRHESEPGRVLPFFPVFLAAMNFVLVADDAFTFLLSWELMSLASWALVMAHSREPANARAGFVYILMASLGTFALLLAFGLLAGADGHYAFDVIRAHPPTPVLAGLILALALFGAGLQGRPRAAARLAAARPSRRAQPCLRADERRDDQGGRLRVFAPGVRPQRSRRLVVGHSRPHRRRGDRRARRAVRAVAERFQARAGLFDH